MIHVAPAAPERPSLLRRVDWVTAGAALCLSLFGSLLVWSATRPRLLDEGADPQTYLKKHLLNLIIGVALGAVVTVVDYRLLRTYTPIVYVGSILALVAVLLVGATINGAHSWIVLGGGFQLQPSEFAKVAVVVGMALLFAERRKRESTRGGADVLFALAIAVVPVMLILMQPDVGTAMVLAFVVFAVLIVAGVSVPWLLGLALTAVLVGGVAVQLDLLEEYQLDRFRAFTNPDENLRGAAYNINQARIAIGSGGLTGTGLFDGTQTTGQFVPEQETDFVFTVAGEEFGFLGAGVIILLYGVLLWRALRLAGQTPDLFGRLTVAGVASWFGFQAFINIGMTLGIMPITGLPLPFVSYGGSSMFANWIAIGLLLNVHLRVHDRVAV